MKAKKASAPPKAAKVVLKPKKAAASAPKAKAAAGAKAAKPSAVKTKTAAQPAAKPKAAPAAKTGKTPATGKTSAAKTAEKTSAKTGTKPASAKTAPAKPASAAKPAASATAKTPGSSKKNAWFEISGKTPRLAHYRMPAEWETHYGTWLTWPNKKGISFPGKGAYEAVLPALEAMLHALIASEEVFINAANEDDKQVIRDMLTIAEQRRVHFLDTPSMEPWCRDHGPTFVVKDQGRLGGSVTWKFNSWGGKYDKANVDAQISRRMAEYMGGKIFEPGIVLEGGSIEVNGTGTVLVTESCLLNKNRNRGMKKDAMEKWLKDFLSITNVLWLPGGLEGDDTDGHIDTITRFINKNTVVTCVEDNAKDKNHAVLKKNLELLQQMKTEDGTPLEVIPLPMPQPITRKGQRLPATYANFYIGNKVVLLPTYEDQSDEKALEIMVKAFPTRRIYPIDCRELIWGLGAFHCLTQQLPLAAFPKVLDLLRNPPPAPRPVY